MLAVLICLCILVSKVDVEWGEAFKGFLPSKALSQHGGSALATQDRALVNPVVLPSMSDQRATRPKGLFGRIFNLFRLVHTDTSDEFASHADRPNNSPSFIKAHLHHSIVDIIVNLLGLAVVINSL